MRTLASALVLFFATVPLFGDAKKLTEDQRIDILRNLLSEYAKIAVLLPQTKKVLEISSDGTWDKTAWQASLKQYGTAGRVGDIIQVTHVAIDKDRIVLQLNGGAKGDRRWYDHIEVGMGNQTAPISGPANAPAGTTVALVFDGGIGEVTSAEVKKMFQPVLDFDKSSVTIDPIESLPEPIKEAVKANKAIVGMNRDQVLLALGRPLRKSRETKNGQEIEDWIYGEPPGRVTFVTFTGDKVIRVKETYAGLGGSISDPSQANTNVAVH